MDGYGEDGARSGGGAAGVGGGVDGGRVGVGWKGQELEGAVDVHNPHVRHVTHHFATTQPLHTLQGTVGDR